MVNIPEIPKRPCGPYFLFLRDIRQTIIQEHPSFSIFAIGKEAGRLWRQADPKTRSKYQKMAEQAKKDYEECVKKFEERNGSLKKIKKKLKTSAQSQQTGLIKRYQ